MMIKELENHIKVLVVEDNPDYLWVTREMLRTPGPVRFQVDQAARLDEALRRLEANRYDIILLDLNLPDQTGLDTFFQIQGRNPEAAIIVLTGIDDEDLGVTAVHRGAQDYLVKGRVDSDLLRIAIRYAIERHHARMELVKNAMIDDLTGLYNRRGFFSLAARQLKLARRSHKEFLLLSADLDRMKWINDTFGHAAGDQALIQTARILQDTFRQSDVVARIGGDEFLILVIDAGDADLKSVLARCQEQFHRHNHLHPEQPYELSLSMGGVVGDPQTPGSLEAWLEQADMKLYEAKKQKNGAQ